MSAVLTTEVRWFFPGDVPRSVQDWFDTIIGHSFREVRRDVYDLEAAHERVGLKRRYPARTLDCKMMLSSRENVDLGFGISGDLEDWIKISQPLHHDTENPGRVVISKNTHAKRFYLDTDTGCEAELAQISLGSITAWSLCLETFGDPVPRREAMEHGLEAVFGRSGPPEGFEFSTSCSWSYPEWISMVHAGSGMVIEEPVRDPRLWSESEAVGQEGSQAS